MAKAGGERTPRASRRAGFSVLVAAVVLLAAACQDWPQYQGDAAHDGAAAAVTFVSTADVGQLAQAWTVPTGSIPPDPVPTAPMPVVANGTLFAATPDGRLVASSTDGTTGCSGSPVTCATEWTAALPNLTRMTMPSVANNVVYEDFTPSSSPTGGTLAAFDATGNTNCSGAPKVCQPLWTASTTGYLGVTVANGVVYVDDIPTESLEAFDANGTTNCSGTPKVCQPLWTAPIASFGLPTVANGTVYVASSLTSQKWAAAFDANGVTNCGGSPTVCQPLWTVTLPTSSSSSIAVSNGVGYVETDGNGGLLSRLVAFDASGAAPHCSGSPSVCQPLWTAYLLEDAQVNTPAVAGGRVFAAVSSGSDQLEAFDAAGSTGCSGTPVVCSPLWTTPSSSAQFNTGSPMVVNGLVYMAGGFYDAAGTAGCSGAPTVCTPLWTAGSSTAYGDYVFAAIDKDTLFIGETDGAVHAFRVPS